MLLIVPTTPTIVIAGLVGPPRRICCPIGLRSRKYRLIRYWSITTTGGASAVVVIDRSEEHTSELQSLTNLVCRLLLEKKKNIYTFDRNLLATDYKRQGFQSLTEARRLMANHVEGSEQMAMWTLRFHTMDMLRTTDDNL